ncbi:hypothetical protein ACJJIX_01835 [Microbulbifer sp. VAAC004]|uniref:hypothetical protein n=1 Tax=unclassified Microbulbifer TaxID=2619833 RepID=UPI0040398627
MKKLVVPAIVFFIASCSSTFTITGDVSHNAFSKNCEVTVFTIPPKKDFDELGVVEFKLIPFVGYPRTISSAKSQASPLVCANGGNALLLWEANGIGQYLKGTVIRVK